MMLSTATDPDLSIPALYSPSLSLLAEWTGLGRSTVVRYLDTLEAECWLLRDRPTVEAARVLHERTRYTLTCPAELVPLRDQPPAMTGQDTSELVPERTQSRSGTRASPGAGPGLVPERDTTNTLTNTLTNSKPFLVSAVDDAHATSDVEPAKRRRPFPPSTPADLRGESGGSGLLPVSWEWTDAHLAAMTSLGLEPHEQEWLRADFVRGARGQKRGSWSSVADRYIAHWAAALGPAPAVDYPQDRAG